MEIPEDPIDVIGTIEKNKDLKYYLDYTEDDLKCYPGYDDYVEQDNTKIYELVKYTSDNVNELNQIIIYFMSGQHLRIVNYGNIKLIAIKKLLLKWIRYYDYKDDSDHNEYKYDIDFIINTECISNTIRISLDNINEITCIIKKRRKDIMISAICTSWQHFNHLGQSWNIICMGEKCSCHSNGLLIPKNCDLSILYKIIKDGGDIPDEIYDIPDAQELTDIEWMKIIDKMKFIISKHFDCAKIWGRQEEEDHQDKNGEWNQEFRNYTDYDYDSDSNYHGLTDEQSYHRFYSLLDFSLFY